MKINLAKVVPALFVIPIVVFALNDEEGNNSAASYGSEPTKSYAAHAEADAYLDRVAVELAQPGLYVDPSVASYNFSAREAERLDDLAAEADAPLRIAVIPADRLEPDDDGEPSYDYSSPGSSKELAYTGIELAGQLYDRVGADGTYAVLVDATSQGAGRSFHAGQWAEEGETYDVEGAAEDAISCCAPDYETMIAEFIKESDDVDHGFWWWAAWICAPIVALVALVTGGKAWGRRRRRSRAEAEVVEVLRPPLNEEVIELSRRVSTLPPGGDPDSALAEATLTVLDLVEQARHRIDSLRTGADATEVTSRLADARYQLTVIDALRAGQPVPDRTPPCFYDPRHGPSTTSVDYRPEAGSTRKVHACQACADMVAAEQDPPIRMIEKSGRLRFYWEVDTASKAYLDGYWRRNRHPLREAEKARRMTWAGLGDDPDDDGEPAFTFVWESDTGGSAGGGGSGWGSGRSGGSRFTSFGGGRSSRSSFRSGGGGGF
ncbi:hypothetical protein ncot_01870 [Nocardioides sp. JQ2195]|uniref:hypothetical protein n=1 Tax=Nocardioides sp. JQ2195 TaxID=2592334 RepID=UPI00143E5397|nr:hypothetical protein [Nocardioides sp. JQ2195]QIX25472.1 hypothetical protein ncot_01870 [Nocardioides sp. JQ2195]